MKINSRSRAANLSGSVLLSYERPVNRRSSLSLSLSRSGSATRRLLSMPLTFAEIRRADCFSSSVGRPLDERLLILLTPIDFPSGLPTSSAAARTRYHRRRSLTTLPNFYRLTSSATNYLRRRTAMIFVSVRLQHLLCKLTRIKQHEDR